MCHSSAHETGSGYADCVKILLDTKDLINLVERGRIYSNFESIIKQRAIP
jgi:hypothetical protein